MFITRLKSHVGLTVKGLGTDGAVKVDGVREVVGGKSVAGAKACLADVAGELQASALVALFAVVALKL